jgi:hypothetical protein
MENRQLTINDLTKEELEESPILQQYLRIVSLARKIKFEVATGDIK